MAAKKNLCEKCTGMCCRYIAFPIETPEDRSDYDDIRWYLCHEDISVFVEDDQWYVSVRNKCRYLDEKTYKCLDYENRPEICRNFEADGCEFEAEEFGYELHFTDDTQMQEYIRVKFDNNLTKRGKEKLSKKASKTSKTRKNKKAKK